MRAINEGWFWMIVLTLALDFRFAKGRPEETHSSGDSQPPSFDSLGVYQSLNFQANWTSQKLFWKSRDFDFEGRYLREQTCSTGSPCELPFLDVLVVPFSHNDPGWLQTFEGYFENKTKYILDYAVEKLSQYEDMTFVWSEISYLSKWWNSWANTTQKQAMKKLITEGRLEILTGGWVMADEASTSLFAMSHQLIEGHGWLRENLNYKPKVAWSIDPFGHGSVMPYLLKSSGSEGMMIQRLHYAMKHWLAEHKNGDFIWNQPWDSTGESSIHCLNAAYDLYPTKHSCGPEPEACMSFNFRDVSSLYPNKPPQEHLKYMTPVTDANVQELADRLIGQYRRTASLTRHNVVATGIGSDFEFEERIEWDQQYENYQKLFQYINSNSEWYNAKLRFGTLSQYFEAVKEKGTLLPNFRGDFFPYSDVFFAYAPAYWTGYYSTRPYFKKLARKADDGLRKAEILYTFTLNYLRQKDFKYDELILSENHWYLDQARKWVALFAHHDGITGTSPRRVMLDYQTKLLDALRFSELIESMCVEILIRRLSQHQPDAMATSLVTLNADKLLRLEPEDVIKKMVLFNGLNWKRSHLVRTLVDTENVIITGPSGEQVTSQVNPIVDTRDGVQPGVVARVFEVVFIAYLPPLGFTTYEIRKAPDTRSNHTGPDHLVRHRAVRARVQCRNCPHHLDKIQHQLLTLSNEQLEIMLDSETGLLKQIKRRSEPQIASEINVTLGKYAVSVGGGAYLSRPSTESETNILESCMTDNSIQVYLVSGPVIDEMTIICKQLTVTLYILQEGYTEDLSAVYWKNSIRPGLVSGQNTGEFFMRFETDLDTLERSPFNDLEEPVLYTDNGLGIEKRMYVSRLPYEGNLYPVVNSAFVEDTSVAKRFSVVMDHAHGFISSKSGRIETVIDRRLPYDDARGIDEGVNDPEDVVSNYVLLLEPVPKSASRGMASLPSLTAQRISKTLNYQPSIFVYNSTEGRSNPEMSLFNQEFPPDIFLVNLRAVPSSTTDVSGRTALMILQNLGHAIDDDSVPVNTTRVLGSDLNLDHSSDPCDLTGDKLEMPSVTPAALKTSMLDVGKPFELKSYNVHM